MKFFAIAAAAILAVSTASAVAVDHPEPKNGCKGWYCGPEERDISIAKRDAEPWCKNWWDCGPKTKRDEVNAGPKDLAGSTAPFKVYKPADYLWDYYGGEHRPANAKRDPAAEPWCKHWWDCGP